MCICARCSEFDSAVANRAAARFRSWLGDRTPEQLPEGKTRPSGFFAQILSAVCTNGGQIRARLRGQTGTAIGVTIR